MSAVKDSLITTLIDSAKQLREQGLETEGAQFERLANNVDQPCVVAVVGQVKSGKSTFINALLRDDLARVGTTETTATINYFRYGNPDARRPVRCHWRSGRYEDVDRAFLDALQGNDIGTLRRADGIDYLEYFLPNPYLKQVTLVDTPGTGAIVEEHQNRTDEFMGLYNQLRERHHLDTQRLGTEADAVVYLVGPVARATDQAFLEEFARATGGQSRALNAIGVIAKIDIQPEVIKRSRSLSDKIAAQLKDQLNTVVPVSAGLRRAVDHLLENGGVGLRRVIEMLRTIPSTRLAKLLDSDEVFRELEFADCPVSARERCRLLGETPWGVFTTLARVAADDQLDADGVQRALDEIAGFDQLKEILDRHFLERGHILHCYRIVEHARRVLNEVRYKRLPAFSEREREEEGRLNRFLSFVNQANGDSTTARELKDFLRRGLRLDARAQRLEETLEALDIKVDDLYEDLAQDNADFEALQQLNRRAKEFSQSELEELPALFGLYGIETEKRLGPGAVSIDYVRQRQLFWRQAQSTSARTSVRRVLAERAHARYGLLLEKMLVSN